MIELVNLEECVGYVVKVNRRDDTTLYGKIEVLPTKSHHFPPDAHLRLFILHAGAG